MVMAAVAEQPPPPCFFSLSSSPLSSSTAPTIAPLRCFPPLSASPRNRSNRSPILPSMRYDGHAGTPLRGIQLTPFLSHSLAPLSTFPPLPLTLHRSASLPWATRCYPRAIRALLYIRLPVSSPHPLPASHLGVCVGRNQGQERSRPSKAPCAIDSSRFRHDDTKGVAGGNLVAVVLFSLI